MCRTVITYFVADNKQCFITRTKMYLKTNSNSEALEELSEQVLSVLLWKGLLPALTWHYKTGTKLLPNRRGPAGLPTLPSFRKGLSHPEHADLAEPHPCTSLPRSRKSLTWLKLNNETIEAARPDGWLKGLKSPFASSQINNKMGKKIFFWRQLPILLICLAEES